MTNLPRKTKKTKPRRYHDRQIDLRLTRSYYNELNEDPRFQRDLSQLFNAFKRVGYRYSIASRFADSWKLPRRYGQKDLDWSFRRWDPEREPRLTVSSRGFPPGDTKRLPPRWTGLDQRATTAHRFYVYVHKGRGYQKVADDEGVDVRAVVDSVRKWAPRVDVELPRRSPASRTPK